MRDDMTSVADDLADFRRSAPNGRLAAALAKVARETPEAAAAALARADAEAHRKAAAERAANRRRRYEEARPGAYRDATYATLTAQQDPEGKGSRWLASGHKNALLVGPSGHGKTHLAYAIGNDAVNRGLWVEAWTVSEMFQALAPLPKHARDDEVRSRRQENILGWVKECDLLLLDDLGAEAGSGYVADRNIQQLTDILTARDSDRRRRNVVTLNGGETAHLDQESERNKVKIAAASSIAERYGARVSTRLQHDMIGVWVEGECFRQAATWNPFS